MVVERYSAFRHSARRDDAGGQIPGSDQQVHPKAHEGCHQGGEQRIGYRMREDPPGALLPTEGYEGCHDGKGYSWNGEELEKPGIDRCDEPAYAVDGRDVQKPGHRAEDQGTEPPE